MPGRTKVLFVDDEDSILQMVRETLADHGFEVDVARDGESGLRRLLQTPYDLALCDWKMPGLNGRQIYKRLCASNPEAAQRFIFMTGDVVNDNTRAFLDHHSRTCLSKPFSLTALTAAISTTLDVARN